MGKRFDTIKGSVGGFLDEATTELEDLATVLREAADGLEENFGGTEQYERTSEAADLFESIDYANLDYSFLPEGERDKPLVVVHDTRKRQPRRTRIGNLLETLTTLKEFFEELHGDKERSNEEMDEQVRILCDILDEGIEAAEGADL